MSGEQLWRGVGGPVRFRMWMLLSGARGTSKHQRTLLREAEVGGALDNCEAMPLANSASVPMLPGMTIIASEG